MSEMFEGLKAALSEIDHFPAGRRSGYKVTQPTEIDLKRIRLGLHMTRLSSLLPLVSASMPSNIGGRTPHPGSIYLRVRDCHREESKSSDCRSALNEEQN